MADLSGASSGDNDTGPPGEGPSTTDYSNRRVRRGRRNRRRAPAQQQRKRYEQFQNRTLQRNMKEAEDYAKHKEEQVKHMKSIAQREQEILSRTVFVTHGLDLNRPQHLAQLQQFVHVTYGAVESCQLVHNHHQYSSEGKSNNKLRLGRGGDYPSARIRFARAQDAERIFGGHALIDAHGKGESAKVSCSVGYQGFLVVRPSSPYSGMVADSNSISTFSMPTSGMALGHWFLAGEDAWNDGMVEDDEAQERGPSVARPRPDEWLQEFVTSYTPTLSLNLRERSAKLVNRDDLGEVESELTFRFKDISGFMELYKEEESFSLYFRLKQPPRVYGKGMPLLPLLRHLSDVALERCTVLDGVPREIFGRCFCYKLLLTKFQAQVILRDTNLTDRLRRFGVLRDRTSHQECVSPKTIVLPSSTSSVLGSGVDRALNSLHEVHPKSG
jgi:hypothetical protein